MSYRLRELLWKLSLPVTGPVLIIWLLWLDLLDGLRLRYPAPRDWRLPFRRR